MRLPRTPPAPDKAVQLLFTSPTAMQRVLAADVYRPTVGDRYLHWDKLRFFKLPSGVTLEEWWAAIKLARRSQYRFLPLLDTRGDWFRMAMPDVLQRQVSEIDRDLSGRVKIPEELTNSDTRDRYAVSALIEEAITSSQLEGAATTSVVAREMLRSTRRPRDKGERMIYNNFLAMQFVREVQGRDLTPDLVCDIHRRITADTLDDEADAGRIRQADDIRVTDPLGLVLHTPPAAAELSTRLQSLCDFASGKTPEYYLHPAVRAALLHLWLGYDHPFVDGNGRTARALFYWSMLHSGYWMCEFISISHILRKAPAKYARAYLYTETDENDSTYFVLYQLDVLQRGIVALHEYVRAKAETIHKTRLVLRQSQSFNHRQVALLGHALRNPSFRYSVSSHSTSHQVTRQTARVDLAELTAHDFLQATKVGKELVYTVANDLEKRLEAFGARSVRKKGKKH